MKFIKNPLDTVIILIAFGFCVIWMNGKFNNIEKQIFEIKTELLKLKDCIENTRERM